MKEDLNQFNQRLILKCGESFVSTEEAKATKTAKPVEKANVDKADETDKETTKGEVAKDKTTEGFGKIIPKGIELTIGGVVDIAKDGGKKVILKVEDMKRRSTNPLLDEIGANGEDGSLARGTAKYVAEAPNKIEIAAKNGISSIINGINERAISLAKKVSPVVKDRMKEEPKANKSDKGEQLI